MVLGQLIFKCRIDYSLWQKILDFITDEANDGYTGLMEYVEEPVNCLCECIEGTKWCEIQLGADSFRKRKWVAIHMIMSFIFYYTYNNPVAIQYCEWEGLEPNPDYLIKDCLFYSTKELEEWLNDNAQNLISEQAVILHNRIAALKSQD